MKNILLLVMAALSLSITKAQNCNAFSDKNNVTNWRGYAIDGISFESNTARGNYLQIIDGSGSSYAVNDKEFSGNWLQLGANGCLCFEYNVDWNQDPSISTPPVKGPKIGIYTGSPANNDIGTKIRAGFLGNASNPDLKDNEWTKFCFPIGLSSNGKLPSNSLGTWTIASGSTVLTGAAACAAWDNLIQNVTGIYLYADYNAQPSELVRFDNFCWTCAATDGGGVTACGCPNVTNLITNGGFESGATGFSSKFSLMKKSFVPGTYTVVDGDGARALCANWLNAAVCGREGKVINKFLVLNGQTGQQGPLTAWGQTVTVETGKDYKLCFNLGNLRQCCFNVDPKVTIVYNDGVEQKTLGPITVSTNNSPCNWLSYTTIISIPPGATPTINLPININLDQSGLGDGNDLAIDDISLIKLSPLPAAVTDFGETISTIDAGGNYTIITNCSALPAGVSYVWEVQEIDNAGNVLSSTGEYPAWHANPLSCNFSGYTFTANKRYRIIRGTWGECNSWGVVAHTYSKEISSNRITAQKDVNYKAPQKQNNNR